MKKPSTFKKIVEYIGGFAAVFGVVSIILSWISQRYAYVTPRPDSSALQESLANIFGVACIAAWVFFVILFTLEYFVRKAK